MDLIKIKMMNRKLIFLIPVMAVQVALHAQTTQRNALAEDFSNVECSPCKTLSDQFHPAIVSVGSNAPDAHINTIAYQLNYPGVDPSYNIHARQRELFYQVTGLPTLKVNGRAINPMLNEQDYVAILDTSRNTPATFMIDGSYRIEETTHRLNIDFAVHPLTTVQGPYKVHAVVVERHYSNPESAIGMFEFYFVMRRMFPDGNGVAATSWNANVAKPFHYETPYQVSNPPAPGSFDFWGNPLLSDLVVFIQDTVTRQVLQSQVIRPDAPTSVAGPAIVSDVMLYPNPARDVLRLAFDTRQREDAVIAITDMSGKVLVTRTAQSLAAGRHEITVSTTGLPAATYLLRLQTAGVRKSKLFSVIR